MYEDNTVLKERHQDLKGQIERVAEFLGQKPSENQLMRLKEHLQFQQFSQNEAVNFEICKNLGLMSASGSFIRKGNGNLTIFSTLLTHLKCKMSLRKGKTGDWKNYFSPSLNSRIDKWMKINLAGTDLKFITELEEQD